MEGFYLTYLVHLAYFFTLLSYCFRNIAWLRLSALVASGIAIYYSIYVSATPMLIPAFWHALFCLVNLIQLLIAAWRRRSVKLNPVESFLGQTALANFPPAEIRSFARLARLAQMPSGSQIIEINSSLSELYCLLKGEVSICREKAEVAKLGPGRFVGEMSLLTHSPARADVLAASDLELIVWPHAEIETWVGGEANRLALLQSALGTQIVEQLLGQNQQIEGGTL